KVCFKIKCAQRPHDAVMKILRASNTAKNLDSDQGHKF
ncbi:MAG: hypothetical protein RL368_941, partial [Pseudomonadota bacterium]